MPFLGRQPQVDSDVLVAFMDSDYISARVKSSVVTDIVDSAYVQARQVDLQRDSAFITNIVDSDYINARVTGVDSASVVSIVDSDYINARVTGVDSASVVNIVDSDYVTARGGSTYDVFWENSQTLATSHTIVAGRSAMSAGPITINNGVTVTIDSDSRWVIV